MLKRFLFTCLTLLFFISVPFCVSADNKIIRQKTVRNAVVTTGNRLTIQQGGKTYNTTLQGGIEDVFPGGVSNDAVVGSNYCSIMTYLHNFRIICIK